MSYSQNFLKLFKVIAVMRLFPHNHNTITVFLITYFKLHEIDIMHSA